jgi:hypothetical protein
MSTTDSSAKDEISIGKKMAWKQPVLRRFDAREAQTGIFLGPELITELS